MKAILEVVEIKANDIITTSTCDATYDPNALEPGDCPDF